MLHLSHWQTNIAAIWQEVMEDGALHVTLSQPGDKARALKAHDALIKPTKGIKADPLHGGAAAIRELRDGR